MSKFYGRPLDEIHSRFDEQTGKTILTAAQLRELDFGSIPGDRGLIVTPIPLLRYIHLWRMFHSIRIDWYPEESINPDDQFLQTAFYSLFPKKYRLRLKHIYIRHVPSHRVFRTSIGLIRSGAGMFERINSASRAMCDKLVNAAEALPRLVYSMLRDERME